MIAMFLTSLFLASLYSILRAAIRYYLTSTTTVSVQQNCLVACSVLSTELLESNLACIDSGDAGNTSVVFGSPRNSLGDVGYDPTSGHMQWQKFVCFWVNTHRYPTGLLRKEEFFAPSTDVPYIPSTLNKAHFEALAAQHRTVAEYIYALEVVRTSYVELTIGAEDPSKQFRVVIATKLKTRN